MPEEKTKLLRIDQAAQYIDRAERTVFYYARKGIIESFQGRFRTDQLDLLKERLEDYYEVPYRRGSKGGSHRGRASA